MAHCLHDIAVRHFTPGHILVVSYNTPARSVSVSLNTPSRNLVLSPGRNTSEKVQEYSFSGVNSAEDLGQLILEELNKIEAWSLLSFNAKYDFRETSLSRSNYEGYILLSSCLDYEDVVRDIGHQVKKLRNTWKWNPRAKFVILVTGVREVNAKLIAEDIVAQLWTSRIVNSVVLIPAQDTHLATTGVVSILDAYVWFPYRPSGKCPHDKDVALYDRWVSDIRGRGHFLHNSCLFPQKIPNDLQGCPLTVSTFEVPAFVMRKGITKVDAKNVTYNKGLEIRILSELAKTTNSSIKYREPPPDGGHWGWDLGNETWNGVTGEIARSYSDIGIAGLWHRCHLIKQIECLRPHLIDKVRWYVPCATSYPRWMSLTRVFEVSLWSGFVATYLIVALVMWQVVKLASSISTKAAQNQAYTGLPKCLLNFWAIILEESASNHPPNVAAIRAVFFAWVLYCWAVNTVYQAYLTSFLIDPGLQHQLASEDEILNSGIECTTETGIIFLYPELKGTRYRHMNSTVEVDSAQTRVAEGTLAFLYATFPVEYNTALKYKDANGVPSICKIKDDFAFNLITIHVPKGFQLKAEYDQVLLNLLQAGLVSLWWEDLKYTAALEGAREFGSPPGEYKYIVLTLKHLQSAFYFLLLGYAMSVLSFLSELSCQHRKWYKRQR
ncbi:hypothetical protein Cfor_12152 [Coptotermes formosanus]|uniref:Ionotropic glutamate receptor C-terminal domain-containing protein n=1 Tax=Coptotermes formosanus TaxID=36987 RepID=A0A6L2PJM2_COPFO|nr:hypothetical protein Cfor_12152 [Coptotermes formosanus]